MIENPKPDQETEPLSQQDSVSAQIEEAGPASMPAEKPDPSLASSTESVEHAPEQKEKRIGAELYKEEADAIREGQRIAAELERKAPSQPSSKNNRTAQKPDGQLRSGSGSGSGSGYKASGSGGRYRGYRQRYRRPPLDVRDLEIDFLHPEVLQRFMSKTGKILPARATGAQPVVQRKIAREIKRARHMGLLPYTHR